MKIDKILLVIVSICFVVMPSIVVAWSSDTSVNTPIVVAADDQESAVLVGDGAGGAIIAWTDYRNSDARDIYAQRVDATGAIQWTTNGVAVCTAPDTQNSIHIISDGNGGAILAWNDRRDGSAKVYAQRLDANGDVQWAANGILLPEMNNPQSVTGDNAGGVILTWSNTSNDVYAQGINGAGSIAWTSEKLNSEPAAAPVLTSDGSGGAIISWMQGNSDVFVQRVDASGGVQWAANGIPVAATSEYEYVQSIVADDSGGALFFLRINQVGYCVQKIDAAGTLQWQTPVWLTNGNAGNLTYPFIIDGQGGALVSWWEYRENNDPWDPNDQTIYVQGVDADGSLRWPSEGLFVGYRPYGSSADTVPIVSDDTGGFIATWVITDSNHNWDLYAQYFNSAGLPQWGADPVVICNAPESPYRPDITSDGAGGAIIVWEDSRNGVDDDVYADRISADGSSVGIQTPSNVSPTDETRIDTAPTLTASAFIDDAGLLSHEASQWRINNIGTVTPEMPEESTSGDDSYFAYQLPFSFPFFERTITSISVNTNGLIELLEDGETDYANDRYGTHFDGEHIDNMDAVFAANDDLDLINGHLRLYNAGTKVVVEWYGATYLDADNESNYPDVYNSMHFQVVLQQDGKITWNFKLLDFFAHDYDLFSGVYPNGGAEISMIDGQLEDVTTPAAFTFDPASRTISPATYQWFTPQPVLYDSGEVADLVSHPVPSSAGLADGVTYYWGVRYKGNNDEWSLWSTPTSFIPDLMGPSVSSTQPEASGLDVAVNTVIQAMFSEEIDADSLTTSSFTLTGPDGGVAGVIGYAAMTASFTPDSVLADNTTYTTTLTSAVTDTLGKPLASDYSWSFTTGAMADTEPPKITSVLPASGAADIAVDLGSVSAVFDESLDTASINSTSFTLSNADGAVTGTVSYESGTNTVRLVPEGQLAYGTDYTATLTTAVQDTAGNGLLVDYTWSFKTAEEPPPPPMADQAAPRGVSGTPDYFPVPADIGAITVTFSEPIQHIDTTSFLVSSVSGAVPGSVAYDEKAMTAWFYPVDDLDFNTQYTVKIVAASIRDLGDNVMQQDYSWTFTTGLDPIQAGCDPDGGNESGCDSFDYFTYGTGVEVNTYGSSITGYTAEHAARGSVSKGESLSQEGPGESSFFESEAIARVDSTRFKLRSRSRRMEASGDLAGAWSMGASKIDVKGLPPGALVPMSIVVSGSFSGPGGTLKLQVRDFDNYRMLGSVSVTGSGQPFVYEGKTYPAITYQQMIDPYGSKEDETNYWETTANGSGGYRIDFLYPVIPNNGIYVWFAAGVQNYADVSNTETDFTATLEVTPPPGVVVSLASGQVFTGAVDSDGDGVADAEDSQADNAMVASPPSATGTGSITMNVSGTAGATLSQVETLDEDDWSLLQDTKPADQQFPDGLVSFRINGVELGGTATVTLTFPTPFTQNDTRYYKVNETGFYEMPETFVDFNFDNNTVTLRLVDGGDGDGDGVANGVIEDPGGVTVSNATVSNSGGSDDWYDSCFITTINP